MLKSLPNKMSLHDIVWKNFPTYGSLVIFLLYMAMFVAQVPPKMLTSELNIAICRACL